MPTSRTTHSFKLGTHPPNTLHYQDRGYARSCNQTSENSTSKHSAEYGSERACVRSFFMGRPGFGSPSYGYTRDPASYGWQGDAMMDRNAASSRMDHGAEGAQAEWLGAMQSLAEQIQKQQQYFQQMTQELMSSYSQLFNIPISYAQEGIRDAQFPIEGYDELTVEEVSARLGALSAEDLREVRDYEERNKNRETILEQLDRRIRSGSS